MNISILESEFKPYLEIRRTNGRIILTDNPLRCGCDVKWILTSNFQVDNLLGGVSCENGDSLLGVSLIDYQKKIIFIFDQRSTSQSWRNFALIPPVPFTTVNLVFPFLQQRQRQQQQQQQQQRHLHS